MLSGQQTKKQNWEKYETVLVVPWKRYFSHQKFMTDFLRVLLFVNIVRNIVSIWDFISKTLKEEMEIEDATDG